MRLRLLPVLPASMLSIAVVSAVLAAPTAASPDGAPSGATGVLPSGEPSAETHQVTLITGDVASLTVGPDGVPRAGLARSETSSGHHAFTSNGDAYLVPSAAQELVAADALDLELFNISGLVEQGYDDARRASLPLIITSGGASAASTAAVAVPDGSTFGSALESVGGVAIEAVKEAAATFWADVVAEPTPTSPSLLADPGVEKIWLDARIEGTLDESAAQVGAPGAWERGLTGAGTTIAVLDSGIDAAHPDVDGRIGASADFTGSGSVLDAQGHGTHVASIAAGSGAASDGLYRGIAPEATLLVGKVLGDDGTGSTSWAIEGMEWAAEQGADVVNLSLGGPVTSGDDPMSMAVDRLTADHDTLFVVAAGNYSPWVPGMEFVTSPAAADSALAVGGVQRPTDLWGGSRRGRMDGAAIKPEIVAPAFGITAAGSAAAGFPPYVSLTGTSMAAPHVAGAAALLKQQHPGWGAGELRAALTSTAEPIDAYYTTYQQGAGRLAVDRAAAQEVLVSDGVLHLGDFSRPFDDGELQVSRTVTYRNESASSVTLDLAATLRQGNDDATIDGALTVEPSSLDLAAGATGEATVTLDASDLPGDTYSGHITASSGPLLLRTTVGFEKQDDTVDVTLRALDRNGEPGYATVRITPYLDHDGRYFADYVYLSPDQTEYTLRLPEGQYNLWSLVTTHDASGRFTEHESIVGDPRLDVVAPDFDVTLDAREAVPVTLDTPQESTPRSMTMSWWRGEPGTTLFSEDTWGWSFNDGEPESVSITPTEAVDDAPFGLATSFDSGVEPLVASVQGDDLDVVYVGGPPVDGSISPRVVDAGTATPAELDGLDLTGVAALVQESPEASYRDQIAAVTEAGAKVVVLYSAQPGVFWPRQAGGPVPVLALPREPGAELAALARTGSAVLKLTGVPRSPYAYDVSFLDEGQVPAPPAYRAEAGELAEVTTNIHTTGTGEHGWRLHQTAFDVCDCGGPAVDDYVPATGYTRTEYVTARPDATKVSAWQFLFGRPADVLYSRAERSYAPGEKATESWLKAPLSPGVAQSEIRAGSASPVSSRTGDRLYFALSPFTDSAGHWTPTFSATTEAARLFRDGEPIYQNGSVLRGTVTVPADEATYRLEADVDHDGSLIGLSTSTRSAWTFRSGASKDTTVLPLIDVDYLDVVDARTGRPALDLANTGRLRSEVRLDLAAGHQNGSEAPPVESLSAQVSYDDGETWRDAEVSGSGGEFSATYAHPRRRESNGFVSLRIRAEDGAGGSLEQTLIRAYRVG